MAKSKAVTNDKTDLLDRVVQELNAPHRNTSQVARDTRLPLRTVVRIKLDRQSDPHYSRVRRLAEYLFG